MITNINVYYNHVNFTWEANKAADVWLWLRLEVGEDEECCWPPTPLVFPMFPDEVLMEYEDGLLTVDVWCKLDPMAVRFRGYLIYMSPRSTTGGPHFEKFLSKWIPGHRSRVPTREFAISIPPDGSNLVSGGGVEIVRHYRGGEFSAIMGSQNLHEIGRGG